MVEVRNASDQVLIRVKDSGVGIRRADYPKLFMQFSRIPNSLGRSVSGTGIGLYLAKHLIALHGGDITVTSRTNHGSTFTIHLPKEV